MRPICWPCLRRFVNQQCLRTNFQPEVASIRSSYHASGSMMGFGEMLKVSTLLAIRGSQLRQHCRRRLRARDHIVIVELLAKRGMCGDLGVPDPEIGMRRIVPQPVLARATLDLRHAFASQVLVSEQGGGSRSPVRTRQEGCERHTILDRLIGALPKVRKHRMRGITKQAEPSLGPARKRFAIIQRPSKRRLNFLQQMLDSRIPAGAL